MLLRRLTGYLRHENWFAIILELVVIVVGLFLAFQLDRWYESQRTKSDLQAHLASLTEDFAENETRLISAISIGKQEMEAAITLRAEIRKDSPDLSVAELNQLISQTTQLPTFNVVDLAYRNLISDGTLADFSSSDLKKELAEFYAAHELTKLIQNTQELQFVTIWQPYALINLDYAATNRKPGAMRGYAVLLYTASSRIYLYRFDRLFRFLEPDQEPLNVTTTPNGVPPPRKLVRDHSGVGSHSGWIISRVPARSLV